MYLLWAAEVQEVAEEENREDEPLEEADACQCDADANECEIIAGSRDAAVDEAECSMREEIQETFEPEPMVMVASTLDGMPVPAGETCDIKFAHPFTIDTCTCIEDERQYVELFNDELYEREPWVRFGVVDDACKKVCWIPNVAARQRAGDLLVRYRYTNEGKEVERRVFEPKDVERWFGVLVVRKTKCVIPVRPIRERCVFYRRQVMANDSVPEPTDPGHQIIFRNCTMRRSVGGAFMTVSNEAVYSCDYRDPPHQPSVEKYLDAPDRERLASKRHLEMVPLFGLG